MTDAAIKAALEAAGEAARKALVKPPCCMEGTGCELPPCHCSKVAAAAAIAAFLRALPQEPWRSDPIGRWSIGGDIADEIAAAVEQAAREGARP
jgi:hypothetical protein